MNRLLGAWLGAFAAVAPVAAQQSADVAVAAAWLGEVLDLDAAGAARTYARIAHDPQHPVSARSLAAARLIELQRLGVATDIRATSITELPPALQPLFTGVPGAGDVAQTTARLVAAAHEEPGELAAALRVPEQAVPALRPLSPEVMAWEPEQTRDPRSRPRGAPRRNTFVDRLHAQQILRFELSGDTARAEARRKLYFDQWKPPVWQGDPVETVRSIRTRLQTLRQGRELNPQTRRDLDALQVALDKAADTGPQAVQGLMARLPVYAELLAGLETQPR